MSSRRRQHTETTTESQLCLLLSETRQITNPRHCLLHVWFVCHAHVCVHAGMQVCLRTHCIKVVEEADGSWVRRLQGELEEGLHVQRGRWDDRWAPEEGRDRPRSVYTSCGRCTNRGNLRFKKCVSEKILIITTIMHC